MKHCSRATHIIARAAPGLVYVLGEYGADALARSYMAFWCCGVLQDMTITAATLMLLLRHHVQHL